MKKALPLLLSLLFTLTAGARGTDLFFNLNLQHGLSDATVSCITQDRYGYMWIGTPNGLNRYDGYTVKTFYADSRSGLPSNSITALYSDSKGGLWVGTSRGLVRYDFAKEHFEPALDSSLKPYLTIYCFEEDKNGNLYIGTSANLLYWHRASGRWQNLSEALNMPWGLALVKDVLLFDEDALYVSTAKRGFYKIDLKRRQVDTFQFVLGKFDECCLLTNQMLKLNGEEILMGSLSLGILKLNLRSRQFSWPKHSAPINFHPDILYNTVPQVLRDRSGRIWIASHYFGLAEYLPETETVRLIRPQAFNTSGPATWQALCLFEDQQQNLWVGTRSQGLFRFKPNQERVRFYGQDDTDSRALQSGNVVALAALDSQTLMVGTHTGLSFFDKRSGTFKNLKGAAHYRDEKALEYPLAAVKDARGRYWIGSSRLGLMRYDPAQDKMNVFTRFSPDKPLFVDGVSKILPIGGDSLLMLNFNQIALFRTENIEAVTVQNDSAHPIYGIENISDFCPAGSPHTIWFAQYNGNLYQYNWKTGIITDHSALLDSLPDPLIIYKLAHDPQHQRLWCATNAGAVAIEQGRIRTIHSIRGSTKTSGEVNNLLPVGETLWMTDGRSMARLDIRTGEQILLGQSDGFGKVKLNPHSLILSPWQTVLIGSHNGFFEIFPEQLTGNTPALPAFLTAFRVYNRPFRTGAVIRGLQKIELDYHQNFFSFDMSAFDYSAASDVEYAYMLEGFDKTWQYTGRNRSGSYTNVPGGNYILKLKARTGGGVWNTSGQQLHIQIRKAFWQTWWFYTLLAGTLLLTIFMLYRNRVRRIRQQEKLRSDYEIKLNELENSALRTQMNPHFIFNSLNTINSFINSNEPNRANQYISKFSRLIRLILDHSREKKINLSDELQVAELYIQLERIRFGEKFRYRIDIQEELDPDIIELPPLIIQPFIENAILHGLLPSEQEGLLSIGISKKSSFLLITVEDNGIGRQRSKTLRGRHPSGQRKSHGIDITLKRIALFNKEQGLSSDVTLTDLYDPNEQPAGTRVRLSLAYSESF